jgi:hypothetical protein
VGKLKAAEEKQAAVHEAENVAAVAASDKQALSLKAMEEASQAFEAVSLTMFCMRFYQGGLQSLIVLSLFPP